jgi:RNA polymerase sigma-70 factor (ECF subfamily)
MAGEGFSSTLPAAQAGAEWALTALYRAHNPRILRYLWAQVGQEAEDVASEMWLDAARNLRSFTGDEDAFRGWLFTIAHRRLIDHRRRTLRRPLSYPGDDRLSPPPTSSAEDHALAEGLGDQAAQRIMAALPAAQAEAVLLRVVGGLSVDQIAAVTGRRPGTIRVLQHRALRRLAQQIGGNGNAERTAGDERTRDATPPKS